MVEDYWYRRPGRSPLTAISFLMCLGALILMLSSDIPLFFAIAPLIPMASTAYQFIRNPTYGIDLTHEKLTVLPSGLVIDLSEIEYIQKRSDSSGYWLDVRLTSGFLEIGSKYLPLDRNEITEELEARGVTIRKGLFG